MIATAHDIRGKKVDGQLLRHVVTHRRRVEEVVLQLAAERTEFPRQVVEQAGQDRVEAFEFWAKKIGSKLF